MSLGSVSGKRGGNEQHAAWITVGVWTSFFFDFVRFDSCSGFLSVLRAHQATVWDNSSSVNALPEVFAVQGVLSSLFLTFHCFLMSSCVNKLHRTEVRAVACAD